jgi:hypothetical protein
MATFVITNPIITLAGVDLSDHVDSVELNAEAADVKTTNFGSGGNDTRTGGLKSGSITISFQQDYAAGSVDATLFANLGSLVAISVKATSAATSATNPLFSGSYLCTQMKPVSGKPGDLAVFSVTFPRSGALTRAVS